MNISNCPICFGALETRRVAPCWDCGHSERELEELENGEHTYAEYLAFGAIPIVLCDFCDADFGSYYAEYFQMPGSGLVGEVLELQRPIDPDHVPHDDKFCHECQHRLVFLEFRAAAIKLGQAAQQAVATDRGEERRSG